MRNLLKILLAVALLTPFAGKAQQSPGLPTGSQLAWQDMEYYLFMHFGPNTFTDKEWGLGDEPEDVFNPANLNCEQWCRIARDAGAKGIIITAKHHDGFCLWPSKYSAHTVRESKWKNGKGDVLKELSAACKKYGLKFGVYISPWDRNHPKYGTPEYNDVFVNMMKEIFQNYGPIWELWWDGANGEGPNGKKQVYDWKRFENTVRELSPSTVIFSDVGPDIRWCGNEKGIAGETNWNYLNTAGFTPGADAPPTDTLNRGNVHGENWIPAECDVSIRPGWFWHENENSEVKTPEQLFDLYLKSVGRGANLLLNVPPDRNGLISPEDSASLIGFKKLREESFAGDLLKNISARLDNVVAERRGLDYRTGYRLGDKNADDMSFITFEFPSPQKVNCIVLKERLEDGQKINLGRIVLKNGEKTVFTKSFTTIGHKRILVFPVKEAASITISFQNASGYPVIYKPEAYLVDERLTGN